MAGGSIGLFRDDEGGGYIQCERTLMPMWLFL